MVLSQAALRATQGPRRAWAGPAIVLIIALSAWAPTAHAEQVGTSVTVRNMVPAVLEWEVSIDEATGIFFYRVVAYDGNGVEDLERMAFMIIDERDGTYKDLRYLDNQRADNRTTARWEGLIAAEGAPYDGPHRVELHVIDVQEDRVVVSRPYRFVDRIDDATQEHAGRDVANESRDEAIDLWRDPGGTVVGFVEAALGNPLRPLGRVHAIIEGGTPWQQFFGGGLFLVALVVSGTVGWQWGRATPKARPALMRARRSSRRSSRRR